MNNISFTAHNILLDDGTLTKPDIGYRIDQHPHFRAAKRVLETVFPQDRQLIKIVDLGCLEGGYAVEFARLGFQSCGIEVRQSNYDACMYVKEHVSLPNLSFQLDDAWNLHKYGPFDVTFCCGLLYHLEHPKEFLQHLASCTSKMVILQTHFAVRSPQENDKFNLSNICQHEGLEGRWYTEFKTEDEYLDKENLRWSSWTNKRSFWPCKEYLLDALKKSGFDLVFEQYDSLGEEIAQSVLNGFYKKENRGTFVGIKTTD